MALLDPDAQPLSEADTGRMKQTPRLKIVRRALGLIQEEFAARFMILNGTLRDWEQGGWAGRGIIDPRSPAERLRIKGSGVFTPGPSVLSDDGDSRASSIYWIQLGTALS